MVLQIANITKETPQLMHLLEEAYNDIYLPAFPIDDERESLDKFKRAINGDFDKVKVVINILGENLEDPKNYVIKGMSVGYYYEGQNVGLLAYNAISPKHREKGLGKLMVDSRISSMQQMARDNGHAELGGVFIEVNDPFKVSPDMDSMDPSKRVTIFKEWGAKQVPIDYTQPPVSADGYYCDSLLLMNYPVEGKYADKGTIENFLRAIYRDYRTEKVASAGGDVTTRVIRAEDDYYFQKMKKQLDGAAVDSKAECKIPGYKIGVPKFMFFG
ncbi:MAG: hypothetical protein PW788_01180 [Micavibrio sp.]|nr:hypothetical protein [Micavibrio sp.]